jgi:hypothetical protein
MKFVFLMLFSYGHFQLRNDLTHIEETNNYSYAFRGYEMAKLFFVMKS